MTDNALLDGVARIYEAARASDDGARCMVAPHPELRERIKSAKASTRATLGLPSALSLRAAEPRVLGFNDGVISSGARGGAVARRGAGNCRARRFLG
jgi:hypothetical protein